MPTLEEFLEILRQVLPEVSLSPSDYVGYLSKRLTDSSQIAVRKRGNGVHIEITDPEGAMSVFPVVTSSRYLADREDKRRFVARLDVNVHRENLLSLAQERLAHPMEDAILASEKLSQEVARLAADNREWLPSNTESRLGRRSRGQWQTELGSSTDGEDFQLLRRLLRRGDFLVLLQRDAAIFDAVAVTQELAGDSQIEGYEAPSDASYAVPAQRIASSEATARDEVAVNIPDATQDLADRLFVDLDWLQECIELLRDRRQIIFYGPPGTGKTYIAQRLAWHIAGKPNVKLVQFHPAYSYEDFFEGYRPQGKANGEMEGFTLKPGPLRRLVREAIENPQTAHVLIIDEINRGNLAKIFGELYFLLEYRDEAIDLMYSSENAESFALPKNLFVIGTMNTSDRSIALIDTALRRRFAFVALHPSEAPTKDVLRRWLNANGYDSELADLYDELNSRISGDDFKIGPSYFMRAKVAGDPTGKAIDLVWRTDLLPLLEEHHFGEDFDLAAHYGLPTIRGSVEAKAAARIARDNLIEH